MHLTYTSIETKPLPWIIRMKRKGKPRKVSAPFLVIRTEKRNTLKARLERNPQRTTEEIPLITSHSMGLK